MTDGALLGIKPIRRDAEHIVALDADAVDDGAYDGAGLDWFVQANRRRGDGFFRDAISRHELNSSTPRPPVHREPTASLGSSGASLRCGKCSLGKIGQARTE